MPALPRVDRIKTIYSAAKALNYAWRFSDFLRVPAANGISKFTPQVHRITLRFCKQSEDSAGMRNFIEKKLVQLGSAHPAIVLYALPVRNSVPIIRAEYGNGNVIQVNAKNLSTEDVERDVVRLLSRSGTGIIALESRQNALVPSIQGQWNPTTWLPTDINVAQLPNEKFSEHKTCEISATDHIMSNK